MNLYTLTTFVVGTLSRITVIGWFVARHLDEKYDTERNYRSGSPITVIKER